MAWRLKSWTRRHVAAGGVQGRRDGGVAKAVVTDALAGSLAQGDDDRPDSRARQSDGGSFAGSIDVREQRARQVFQQAPIARGAGPGAGRQSKIATRAGMATLIRQSLYFGATAAGDNLGARPVRVGSSRSSIAARNGGRIGSIARRWAAYLGGIVERAAAP